MANTLKFGNGEWYGKKDTILAYNDLNSNYKPLPFNFERDTIATVINKDGLIETVGSGQPRIDYKDDSKGALLLEPSRTNLVQYSEDFSNAWWNKQTYGTGVEASVISTTELAPDGSTNAFLVTLNSGSGTTPSDQARIDKSITGLSYGLDYTESIYLKGVNGGEQVLLGVSNIGTIKATLTTEWKRFVLSGTSGGGFNGVGPLIRRGLQEPLNSYAQFYMWGSQFEEGSYATSYIPTQGSTVTRLADSCSQTAPDGVIGQTEGVIFLDVKMPSVIQSSTTFSIGGGASGEYAQLEIRSDLSINWRYRQGNTDYINANVGSYVGGDRLKLAFAYKNGSSVLYKNGLSVVTDNGSIGANSWNNVYFSNYAGNGKLNANVNQMSLYNTRLSNSELQALTQV